MVLAGTGGIAAASRPLAEATPTTPSATAKAKVTPAGKPETAESVKKTESEAAKPEESEAGKPEAHKAAKPEESEAGKPEAHKAAKSEEPEAREAVRSEESEAGKPEANVTPLGPVSAGGGGTAGRDGSPLLALAAVGLLGASAFLVARRWATSV
ncbi:hypothetical protein ACNTMW_01930 [Planosporangium sp. 12N6]|uniref:hypothetical protein n=1 Tax=Planosporangium spinosum TaxID=3402278 RepID=UPI003CEE052C